MYLEFSCRCDHASTVVGERFYILGGSGGQKLWYNDLHFFDTGKEKKKQIKFNENYITENYQYIFFQGFDRSLLVLMLPAYLT